MSLVGAAGSWVPRKTLALVHEGYKQGHRYLRGLALGLQDIEPAPQGVAPGGVVWHHMKQVAKPFAGIIKYRENTKYAETTWTDTVIAGIKDHLSDHGKTDPKDVDRLYEQLIYTFRYGDLSEGIFRYYLDENGGDQILARQQMEKWLSSGVLVSSGWEHAQKLASGNVVSYGGVHKEAVEELVEEQLDEVMEETTEEIPVEDEDEEESVYSKGSLSKMTSPNAALSINKKTQGAPGAFTRGSLRVRKPKGIAV